MEHGRDRGGTHGHDHGPGGHSPGGHSHGGHSHGGHSHGGHGHSHVPANFGKAFAIGVALNAAFVVIEVVFGLAGGSVALLADAGHNLSDALGLGVAWIAVVLAKRQPGGRFTYGLGGASILAALFNAVFLLVVTGGLTLEAVQRFFRPEPVAGATVMVVAACGIVLNGFCAWLFASGSKDDLNVRGAFTHMAADALVSLGVVAAGAAILLTGKPWIDPLVSLVVNALIVWGTWGLLTGSLGMAVGATPAGIDLAEVRAYLAGLPGVASVHDLHVWPLSTTETALSCHMVVPGEPMEDAALFRAADELEHRFGIGHATLQAEKAPPETHLRSVHA